MTPPLPDDLPTTLNLNDWVVLALLAESPQHGFAIAKQLDAESDLGRVLTLHRPLVYRALGRLDEAGFAEVDGSEPGHSGPKRTRYRPTNTGQSALDRWFDTPVGHVRDLRIEFLVKMRLLERRGAKTGDLRRAQQQELAATLARLKDVAASGDVVDRWRAHQADAVLDFLAE